MGAFTGMGVGQYHHGRAERTSAIPENQPRKKVNTMRSNQGIRRNIKRTLALSLLVANPLLIAAVSAQSHVDNPFVGATGYVNPDYAKKVDASIAKVKVCRSR